MDVAYQREKYIRSAPDSTYMITEFDIRKKYANLPLVALAGRPNVGKSTLFNRLLHKRRAITDPIPGVTRDPVEADGFIVGKPVRLADTGGYKLEKSGVIRKNTAVAGSSEIDALVLEKTLETIKKADLIILLFEAGEISGEDEELVRLLRPYQDRLIAVVNKTEGGRREADAWNILAYGFQKIIMISAEHGDNIGELENEIIRRLDFTAVTEAVNENPVVRIALLGKPNTGKSSILNRLVSSDVSIVSDIPGTTRDVVESGFTWKNREFVICDTAGIRRKSKVYENIEYYSVNRAIKTIDSADIVFLIIDAQEGLSDQDKKIASLAHDKGRGIILVLNKWDLMENTDADVPAVKNVFNAVSDRIRFMFGQMEYAPIVPVSAKTGDGFGKLLSTAVRMYGQLITRIGTSQLNKALEQWLQEYPPPIGPRTRFKVKYMVQSSSNPVKFIIFVSRLDAVSESYIAYLRNKIRADLGFPMIPVLLELRPSGAGDRKAGERDNGKSNE